MHRDIEICVISCLGIFLRIDEAINSYYCTIYVTPLASGYKNRPKDLLEFVSLENTKNTILSKINKRPNKMALTSSLFPRFVGVDINEKIKHLDNIKRNFSHYDNIYDISVLIV